MLNETKILLVEDDSVEAGMIKRIFAESEEQAEIIQANTMQRAIELMAESRFDVVITDLNLPDCEGLETVSALLGANPTVPLVVLTGCTTHTGRDVIRAGAKDFIPRDDIDSLLLRTTSFAIERFKFERALLEANAKLEARNHSLAAHCEASKQFVDNVSHEFRTPLTVIREYASIVRDGFEGPVNSRQANRLDTLINRTDDLAGMVDDILDTSQLGLGLVRMHRSRYSLRDAIHEVTQMLEFRAKPKRISLVVDEIPTDACIFCDCEKFRRILINLITNAIKFTTVGGEIRIDANERDEFFAINVTDNGVGIPQKHLSRIFGRFEQVCDDPRAASAKGFGLGLGIASALATMNLGKLEVASEVGCGSTFTLLLPKGNSDSILKCYFDQRKRTQNGLQCIATLEVTAERKSRSDDHGSTQSDEMQFDRINSLISSQLTNKDLVLKTQPNRWIVYVETTTNSVKKVVHDLNRAHNQLKSENQSKLFPQLSCRELGHFQLDHDRSKLEAIGLTNTSITSKALAVV